MDIQVSFSPKPKPIENAHVGFTDAAADKVNKLAADEGKPGLMLRVSVSGGGCSGYQYDFAFDDQRNDDDYTNENRGATMVIDVTSMQYLNGSTVDYIEGLEGARFVVDNPNADSTCGCGSSFSITF